MTMQAPQERPVGVLIRKSGKVFATAERPGKASKFLVRRGSELTKRPIDWLWKPYLQQGALNLITGDPEIGKSTLVCEIVASLTTGRALPNSIPVPPMNCWIMNGEDNAEDTTLWRLENQKADISRVFLTDQLTPIEQGDIPEIIRVVREHQIGMLIIDPIQGWMGNLDMNAATKTRQWAGWLRDVAQRTGAAIVFVRHRRKGGPGDNHLYAGLGSIDITGFARSELSVMKTKSGRCYMARTKGNVGQKGAALSYTVEPHPDKTNDHGVFQWRGEINLAEHTGKGSNEPKKLGEAMDFLSSELLGGPKTTGELQKAASAKGITTKTLQRARDEVAESFRTKDGWFWQLKTELMPEHLVVGQAKEAA